MKKMERSQFNMGNRCDGWFVTQPTIIPLMINFPGWWVQVQGFLGMIAMFLQIQDDFLPAFMTNRKLCREIATQEALTLAAILCSFANATNNTVLFGRMNIKKSYLDGLSSVDFIAVVNKIGDVATELVDDLLLYGVTVVTMTEYTRVIEDYVTSCAIPANAKLAHKESTRQISYLLKQMMKMFVKMDGDAFIIRNSHPLFYEQYKDARKLVDPGTFMQAARGTLLDSDGNPIVRGKIQSSTLGIDRRVSEKGGFVIKHAPEGPHDITFTHPGFEPVTRRVIIAFGSRAEMNVVMERIEVEA